MEDRKMRITLLKGLLLSAVLLIGVATSATAQTSGGGRWDRRADRRDIRRDTRDIRTDRRDLRKAESERRADIRDLREDRKEGESKQELRTDRRQLMAATPQIRHHPPHFRSERPARPAHARSLLP